MSTCPFTIVSGACETSSFKVLFQLKSRYCIKLISLQFTYYVSPPHISLWSPPVLAAPRGLQPFVTGKRSVSGAVILQHDSTAAQPHTGLRCGEIVAFCRDRGCDLLTEISLLDHARVAAAAEVLLHELPFSPPQSPSVINKNKCVKHSSHF